MIVHLNKCKLYHPPPEMCIPFQPTCEFQSSHVNKETWASESESVIVPAMESDESSEHESTETFPPRRSNRDRKPPLRFRDDDSLNIRRGK